MNTTLIAIDPGAHGGIAWRFEGEPVDAIRMPSGMTDIHSKLQEIASVQRVTRVLIEKTGTYRKGNTGPGAVKFARHCGHLEALVYGMCLSCRQIAPNQWMKSFLGAVPKDKRERKLKIKEQAQLLYPHLAVTLLTADALGLLTVLLRTPMER